ncbi:MAG TPA: prenyltransferase/squalene oxidase repeat-containing protein, partial [Solirubrobacteraceae bacterium]|nr:prenyltransferase/squalene oxidase repeat-containing protein [Solirubrobacteraceae bacterium]
GEPAAGRAREALGRFAPAGGGLATYRDGECPRPGGPRLTPPDGSYAGWCAVAHPCVAAAAGDVDFLRDAQRADGSWAAYWWADDAYATALAAEALAASGRAGDRERVEAAARWGVAREASGPFATAWRCRLLRLAPEVPGAREAHDRSVAWLLARQEDDGGWPASARMIAPRPDLVARPADGVPVAATLDDARVFTTAAVLSALLDDGARSTTAAPLAATRHDHWPGATTAAPLAATRHHPRASATAAALAFLREARRDDALARAVEALDEREGLEGLRAIGARAGFAFTVDELRRAHAADWGLRRARFAPRSWRRST